MILKHPFLTLCTHYVKLCAYFASVYSYTPSRKILISETADFFMATCHQKLKQLNIRVLAVEKFKEPVVSSKNPVESHWRALARVSGE